MRRTDNSPSLDDLSRKYVLDKSMRTRASALEAAVSAVRARALAAMGRPAPHRVARGWRGHNYIPGYTSLFEHRRCRVRTLLEIGIGSVENGQMGGVVGLGYRTGNSLRCWRDYFPHATVFGIDLYEHKLDEHRIVTMVADQSRSDELDAVIATIGRGIDIVIDDGSHQSDHQVFSFMHLERHLSDNGVYVIEDIQPVAIEGFRDLSLFPIEFQRRIRECYDVEYFDTRASSGRTDDFMLAFIRKPQALAGST